MSTQGQLPEFRNTEHIATLSKANEEKTGHIAALLGANEEKTKKTVQDTPDASVLKAQLANIDEFEANQTEL